ncbi:AarF/ABC1/UbiB kinase family protein [Massilia sp. DJPM01]|uniref:ABC1 kinase family protein n=1 Tax=Massilia sp. DJPM01 TaxID=3024404 RepID=UPI00259D7458|nr:AarF/ABC1/UbiB kinase family protein [Massilia sp. DJPM01]MDM5177616.1 AarF/ABC1/UbiB kinase family protein [Massilia sp. DJPM01]
MKTLDPRLIPSTLLSRGQQAPVEVRPLETASLARTLGLVARLLGWICRLILYRVRGRPLGLAMAVEIRSIIEDMGGLWVKTGQLLSLRTDLLSPEFSRELSRLQYAAVGFPFAIARRCIEDELGQPLEVVFSHFDEHPVAAASICQVHRATLRSSGQSVAVKVQRPGIDKRFARDLFLLRILLKSMRYMPGMGFFTWDEMLWETTQIFREEVDYRYEASNTLRLRKSLRAHKVYVPQVFDCSTRRLLVLEWVPGVLMSSFLEMGREDPEALHLWCRENHVDAGKVGEKLFLTFFRQLFEDNLFHGDLHPGNILLLRDSRLALIDFGSAGTNDATLLEYYKMSMKGVGEQDFPMAVDYLFLLSDRLPPIDIEAVKAKVVRTYQAWSERAEHSELPYYEKSIGNMGLEAGNVLIENQIVLSWSFMKISRTWATLDASLAALLPEVNYMKLVSTYFKGAQKRAVGHLCERGVLTLVEKMHAASAEAQMQLEEMGSKMFRLRAQMSRGEYFVDKIVGLVTRTAQVITAAVLFAFGVIEYEFEYAGNATMAHLIDVIPDVVHENRTFTLAALALLMYCGSRLRAALRGPGR